MLRPRGAASLPAPETDVLQFRHPQTPGAVPPPSRVIALARSVSPVDVLIAAAFAILLVAQIARHEMWRDEIHSWGLVLASPSLSDLFANLRFTGHPGLWYLLLWLASWFTDSPYAVQIVHAAIALLLIGSIGLLSPFSRLEKLLLLSSYFVLYEYTVVSRSYGLGFLIALTYANRRATRPDRVGLNVCLLGLLANTNMFAFVLSAAFALEYAVELLFRRGKEFRAAFQAFLPPAAIYLAFAALSVATMWPSPDISLRTIGVPLEHAWDPFRLLNTVAGNVASLIPIRPLNYWNARAVGMVHPIDAAALPALALLLFQIFRRNRQLLLVPALTAVGSIAIGQLIYANSIRHWGINFIAFIAVLWMQRVWSPQRSHLALALLAVSAAAGIAVSVQQFPLTFSEGRTTAQWIRDNDLSDSALVGEPDALVTVVAQYLAKPIYFLDCSCTDTYLFYHKRRDTFDKSQLPERLARAVREFEGRPILFLTTGPLDSSQLTALRDYGVAATHLAAFDNASTDENFYVYRVAAAQSEGVRASESRIETLRKDLAGVGLRRLNADR